MMGKSVMKVENGKLIKTFLDYGGGRINEVRITGDFFAHPEEGIEALERELAGTELKRDVLEARISGSLRRNGVVLFGADPESLAACILGCAKEGA
jgi:hypothetical protein